MKNLFLLSLSFLALFMIKSCGGDVQPTVPQIEIYSKGNFNCALFDNESTLETKETFLKCWGEATYGFLGSGDEIERGDSLNEMGDNLSSVDLGTSAYISQMETGNIFSCAILDNESTVNVVETLLKCWGLNGSGELGQEDADNKGDDVNEMGDNLSLTNLGDSLKIIEISTGVYHSCAMLDDENTVEIDNIIKCWGHNFAGRLGLGDTNNRGDDANEMGNNLPFVSLGLKLRVLGISTGFSHNCVILDDTRTLIIEKKVKCWGANAYGQLSYGDTTKRGNHENEMGDNLAFVNLGTNIDVLKITASFEHTCAVIDNKSTVAIDSLIKCWGRNQFGQLGQGSTTTIGDTPNEIGDNLSFTDIGIGTRLIKNPPL